ncbi:MAG TPA: VanZ family protein, partial [Gemmatimonadales bacterium]|nr:VanZ family protein [Gemmatimonadales bacterium]
MSLRRIAALPRPLRFALGLTVGAILYATLQPADVVERVPPWWCIACGDRGRADFILNVILFLPFGCAIGLAGARWRTALWSGLFLSTCIELTQTFVPGRDTSLGDVISNSAGAVLGFFIAGVIVAAARRHQSPALPTALATALALVMVAGTGVALR